jgi:hypothetical protein
MNRLLASLFGCRHKKQTRVFADAAGQYRACLDCGTRLAYSEIEFPTGFYRRNECTQLEQRRQEEIAAWLRD